ncbi:MAG: hypothetical protein WCH11_03655 [Bdellovibrio sp.]
MKTAGEPGIQSQSRRIVAQLYQDSGQLELAAPAYARAAQAEASQEVAANLHYNSALLYQALRQSAEALVQYEAFSKKSKGPDRGEALWQSAQIHKENKQLAKASEAFKSYLGFPRLPMERRIEAHFEISEIAAKLGRSSEAEKERRQALQLQRAAAPQRRGVGAAFAARIRLQEIRRQEQEFRSLRIPKDASKQARVVQEKIARMNKLNEELADVIRFDSPDEIVGALQVLASVNHHMAQSLLQSPPPAGLSPDELAQYKAGVAQVAEPFSKKALESVQRGLERARELESYGPEYRELLRVARQIQPDRIEDGTERVLDSNYVHWMGL